jgi:hypothetical protein
MESSDKQIPSVGESGDADCRVAYKRPDFEGFPVDTLRLPVDQQGGFDSQKDDKPDCKLDEFADNSVHSVSLSLKQAILEVSRLRFIVFGVGFVSGCFFSIYVISTFK